MSFPGLSPESLARLEAQLQADLDAVRRVRALLTPAKDAGQPLSPAHGSSAPPPVPLAAPEEKGAMTPAGAIPLPIATVVPAPFVPPPGVGVAVPQAVALMDGEFGLKALRNVMAREHLGGHPDTEIRRVLNKMVKSGGLRVVNVGRGRGGSTYQRVAQG